MLSKLPLPNENYARLFSILAEATRLHADAAADVPLKGQLTWGFFRMGADSITAPANNNTVDTKTLVARAFADNRNEIVYGVTAAKPPVFTAPVATVSGRAILTDYVTVAQDVLRIEPLPAPTTPQPESSDSFDSTKIVSFEKYKRDLARHTL